jgi:MoaA/NifB/PqqE/SkfB family radical SAM enzyme
MLADPFLDDHLALTRGEPPADRRGMPPRPDGSYEHYKRIIEEAVKHDHPPSRDLIRANTRLATWEAFLGIGKVSSFPVKLHVALNDICNARCRFCQYAPEHATASMVRAADIRRAKWLKFVEAFMPNGGLSEPLIHPEIVEIMEQVHENAPFIQMFITTNASLLNDKIIRSFAGFLTEMFISLNAARKETYEFLMNPLKWERTLDNIKRLQKTKAEIGTDKPTMKVSYVLNKHNFEELPELPEVLASLGIGIARVMEMAVPRPIQSRKLLTIDDMVPDDRMRVNKVFSKFKEECTKHRISLTHPLPTL